MYGWPIVQPCQFKGERDCSHGVWAYLFLLFAKWKSWGSEEGINHNRQILGGVVCLFNKGVCVSFPTAGNTKEKMDRMAFQTIFQHITIRALLVTPKEKPSFGIWFGSGISFSDIFDKSRWVIWKKSNILFFLTRKMHKWGFVPRLLNHKLVSYLWLWEVSFPNQPQILNPMKV